jgi:hypothetical protein
MKGLTSAVGAIAIVGWALAADAPRFENYAVSDMFRGQPVPPILSSHKAREFRTVLRREAASGPNFAGHFTIARWGCGAGCVSWAIIDARSGAVWFAPFTVWDARGIADLELAQHSINFQLNSDLVIVNGALDGEGAGTYYYRWRNGAVSKIYSVEHGK